MGWAGGVGASRPAIRGDHCGSKFVSTAREDKCGPGEIGIPRIGIIRAGSKPTPRAADSPDSEDMYSRLERYSRYLNPDMLPLSSAAGEPSGQFINRRSSCTSPLRVSLQPKAGALRDSHARSLRPYRGGHEVRRRQVGRARTDGAVVECESRSGAPHSRYYIIVYMPREKLAVMTNLVMPGWVPCRAWGNADHIPGILKAHDALL